MPIESVGKFAVLDTLGSGAHSSVLRIRRQDDGKEYALKVVNIDSPEEEKFLDQLRHEYRVGQMLNHPHLIKIHCLEIEGGGWFSKKKKAKLLVEFAGGKPLDTFGLLKPARLLRVFERVASGLVHMHKQGVLHADLKPHNIILGRASNPKVIDYGLAWIKGETKDRVQGTPEYMAPETAQHKLVNERTDLYNFGATMYRVATLKLPPNVMVNADGMQISETMYDDQLVPVDAVNKGLPKGFVDLVHACLAFNALKRPGRMSEVQGTLDRLAEEAEAKLDPSELEE
jgi:eukaryotic-like serine/threonine-protein kinase